MNKQRIIISLAVVVCIIGGIIGCVAYNNARKNNEYNVAISLFEAEEYEQAVVRFEKLDNYKESKNYVVKCEKEMKLMNNYDKALSYLEKDEFDKAEEIFTELGDYKDSEEMLEKTKIEKKSWGKIKSIKTVAYDVNGFTREELEKNPEDVGGGFAGITFAIEKVDNATGYEARFVFDYEGKTESVTYKSNKLSYSGQDGPSEYEFRAYKELEDGTRITGEWVTASWNLAEHKTDRLFIDEWEKIEKNYVQMDDDVWKLVDKLHQE